MGIVTNTTDKYQKCIDACNRCAQACSECMTLCLHESDVQARINCIATLSDCAKICNVSACFMASDSQFAHAVCQVCATLCAQCAAECGKFTEGHCVKCAEECQKCAAECKSMLP